MFLLLVACGAIYMVLGDRGEALMLLGFVFVVMGITFVQQRRTERSLEALRDLSSPRALVVRDGAVAQRSPAASWSCGDIVLLAEGDRVPADMRLLEASNLTVDESLLTGESAPVPRMRAAPQATPMPPAADARRMAFSGTLVTQGTARGRVVATGRAQRAGPHRRIAGRHRQRDHADPAARRGASSSAWRAVGLALAAGAGPARTGTCAATGCTACWPA